ncbi:unnamed protein product [Rotaria sordida]|uniref:Uncharacterized protein n=1 Tax=Rotaria sordida TaxID=392033 RepID=A0A814SAY4_9BILA|nr:unnamed protein product [Rotaria sordida]
MTESSSSSITSNTIFIYNDDDNNDISMNKSISVNDVLAIKNNDCYFKIGKVYEINDNLINITWFHYKVDVKSEQVTQQEVLFNFGNIGPKSIFELNDKRQKLLINKLVELGM